MSQRERVNSPECVAYNTRVRIAAGPKSLHFDNLFLLYILHLRYLEPVSENGMNLKRTVALVAALCVAVHAVQPNSAFADPKIRKGIERSVERRQLFSFLKILEPRIL